MIYKQCVLTIAQNTATLDEDIYLYRLDKNVELYFTIVNNKYKFDKSDLNNIINVTNASYFQVRLYKDDEIKYTFAIQPTEKGKAILTITDQLIDEPVEVGDYDFQISLLDADKSSMVSMPIAKQQLHICEPLVDNQAIMGKAVLGLSSLASGEIKNAFDSEGNYIREIHKDGDILSAQLVNKFEEALDTNTKSIKSQNNNLPHTISSKKIVTIPANDIDFRNAIKIKNISINKDKRYYIEFKGIKKLCNLIIDEAAGNSIICNINNYKIVVYNYLPDISIFINILDTTITDENLTDLVIYEEENTYLDSKYLESDLILQNSISLGRVGNIGSGSSAIGIGVEASGIYSHAEGNTTKALGIYSHAEGNVTKASGESSHTEGDNTEASGIYSHAEGNFTITLGESSHAEGYSTTASGDYSHAEGNSTTASGNRSHAEGESTTASGSNSHTEGYSTTASGGQSHAEGNSTTASGNTSHAEGINTKASSEYQHVQGKYNIEDTKNKYAHIVGNGTTDSTRSNAHTLDWEGNAWYAGQVKGTNLPYTISSKVLATVPASNIKLDDEITINNVSINKDRRYYIEFLGIKKLCSLMISEAVGNSIICNINNYIIEGFNDSTDIYLAIGKINNDINDETFTDLIIYEEDVKYLDSKYLESNLILHNSVSLGRIGNIGPGSSAIGVVVEASGDSSHAEGYHTTASGNNSHAEGNSTTASSDSSHTEGNGTTASGDSSHAEGNGTTASGNCSHSEGISTMASGNNSHAEGDNTKAFGDQSHAEGYDTTASGAYSHAEGKFTVASGQISHAEGRNTTASGESSYAEGYGTIASGHYQHVQGKFNKEDTTNKYAHIVGNGSVNNRSNAHTLDWEGNAWFAGQVEGTNLPYNISSKKIATVPASNIKLNDFITINNITINKDRKYYIEFLGIKKLCMLILQNNSGELSCTIGDYMIMGMINSSNLMLSIHKMSSDNTTVDTFTDLIIYEEEIKCLNNKYLENDLTVQNSISLGRIGNIGTLSSAVGQEVTATGEGSHSEGYGADAAGNFSHAEGSFTKALAEDAHAEGSNTIAAAQYQHVQGQYNIKDTEGKYAHIVGNGKYEKRSNAHTLDWEGNAWFAGKVTQEGTPTDDKDLVNKKYVDDKISGLPQLSFNESGELVVTINGVSKTFVPKDS